MKRLARIAMRVAAAVVAMLLLAALAGVLVLRSDWFRERARERIVREVERATGGRAELERFSFDWRRLRAEVAALVVHGKESAAEPPLLRVESLTLEMRIISAVRRDVDLASLTVDRPRVYLAVYPDGSTNLPSPARRSDANWAQQLLRLKVGWYQIREGLFEFDQRRLPLNLRGEDLSIRMDYEPAGSRYRGEFATRRLRVTAVAEGPFETGLSGAFTLDANGFAFPRMEAVTSESRVELAGSLDDVRRPRGAFDVRAQISVREAVRTFGLPVGPQGSAAFAGRLRVDFGTPFDFALNGRVNARGLGYVRDRLKVENAVVRADVQLTANRLALAGIRAEALGATIRGEAQLARWRRFHMDGEIEGLELRRAAAVLTDRGVAWSGTLNGPFRIDETAAGAEVRGDLAVTPGGDGIPVQGQIHVTYSQAAGTVDLGSSWMATPATRVDLDGTLGRSLHVRLRTGDPDDLLPAIAMARGSAPASLPLKLTNGSATAEGTVTGPLEDPRFAGQVRIAGGVVEGHAFDRFTAEVEADPRAVRASGLTLARGMTEITGSAGVQARGGAWEDGAIAAALNVRNADVAALLKEWGGRSEPVSGTASATVRATGTLRTPEAEIVADVAQPEAYGERAGRLRATIRYGADRIEIANGDLTDGLASVRFGGLYRKSGADWNRGEVVFDAATQNLPAARIDRVARMDPPVDAVITGRVQGAAQVANGTAQLRALSVVLAAERVAVDRQALGNLELRAETRGNELEALLTGRVREVPIEGRGRWTLEGDYPGSATLRFSRISVAVAHQLSMLGGGGAHEDDVPFDGFLEGGASLRVSLRSLQNLRAEVTLDAVQIHPRPAQALRLGVEPKDLVFRNDGPVIADVTRQEARLRQARFAGRDTRVEATGAISLGDAVNASLALRGNIDLILLQLFHPDLLARGAATVDASVRGSIRDPALNGRLTLKGASLYFRDLPNGLDNANGSVVFDRNRATVEKLTAETGGGTLSFGGVVEFGSPLVYRLQATARSVRVRWPEDLSTTYDARLGLSGTAESSTLSGTLTLNRAAFNPRTDLGTLLAQASRPVPAPASPSEYLRGMQFDVRVESGPNFSFETSLTRDVEAEVDLDLHGTPLRPVLLGTISVNQGEVQVFGNRYTIDRGEVRFLNPVKIEPTFDMELATRARGVTVNVSLSGSLQQLKVNYSSDPPLQSSEIIALLTVGRDPTRTTAAPVNPSAGAGLAQAGGELLGQAVNAQISSRLQRFFGASRVKIDPTLTGVDNLPQARLTLEQQVSKDITLTYIMNLNRTQEQLVRVQWDFNRNWSAIAVRDPNGLFGIDFQYRKRF
jgi:translocation and assembly module TamB